MKYIIQLSIILGVSFIGEVLNFLLPLPIPASIYALIVMLLLLCSKILKVSDVRETGELLLAAMPIMFVPAGAGIIKQWPVIKPILLPTVIVLTLVTIIVMVVTGKVTQGIINMLGREKHNDK